MPIDWELASKELAKPLDPRAVKPPPQGKFGEYVDGLHVISEANRIFGRDGWSYTVTRLDCASNAIFDTPRGPQARVAYVCAVRVDVGGVIREGLACGTGNGKPENVGDVIESAVKEAETDALKRALRSFGNTFGLALYEKDKAKREVGYAPEEAKSEDIAAALDMLDGADSIDDLRRCFASLPAHVRKVPIVENKGKARAAELKKTSPAEYPATEEIPY
jgi:recombination DNA repair RAD52 pathway protein